MQDDEDFREEWIATLSHMFDTPPTSALCLESSTYVVVYILVHTACFELDCVHMVEVTRHCAETSIQLQRKQDPVLFFT